MKRSKNLQDLADSLSKMCFGEKLSEIHKKKICIQCKRKVEEIADPLSKAEYEISGLCQVCQIEYFGEED